MTFGYMTTGRACLSDKKGKTAAPGPGAYNAKQNRTGKFDITPAHGKAGKCLLTYNAEVPGHRVAEDPSTVKSRAIVPGPGSYDAKFDKTGHADVQPANGKHGMCLLTYNEESPGHRVPEDPGTTKSRAVVPGPGSYDARFDNTGNADVQPANGKHGMCLLTYNEDTPGHRVAEDLGTTKSRAIVPGPGSYDARFDKTGHADVQPAYGKNGMCLLTYNEETPGHRMPEDPGTTKSRAVVPGPGSYESKVDRTGHTDTANKPTFHV